MSEGEGVFESVAARLDALVKSNAVVGRTIEAAGRYAIPLVELSLGLGGGGGSGEAVDSRSGRQGRGMGGAAGGGAKATPVAVLVIDGDRIHVTALGH